MVFLIFYFLYVTSHMCCLQPGVLFVFLRCFPNNIIYNNRIAHMDPRIAGRLNYRTLRNAALSLVPYPEDVS